MDSWQFCLLWWSSGGLFLVPSAKPGGVMPCTLGSICPCLWLQAASCAEGRTGASWAGSWWGQRRGEALWSQYWENHISLRFLEAIGTVFVELLGESFKLPIPNFSGNMLNVEFSFHQTLPDQVSPCPTWDRPTCKQVNGVWEVVCEQVAIWREMDGLIICGGLVRLHKADTCAGL